MVNLLNLEKLACCSSDPFDSVSSLTSITSTAFTSIDSVTYALTDDTDGEPVFESSSKITGSSSRFLNFFVVSSWLPENI